MMKDQRKIPSRKTSASFGPITMEAIKEAGQIVIPTNVNGKVSQLLRNGCPIPIYCAMFLLKKVQEEISNLLYSGRPEVQVVVVAPTDKKGPLCFIH